MSIIYNSNVPLSTNNPSNDQPEMLINTQSIAQIIGVDHLGFSPANPSGTHTHVTFATAQTDPGLSDSQTQIYPKTFGTGSTYLETYTAAKPNGAPQINGYLPFVKAMAKAVSTGVAGPLTIVTANTLSINVASIVLGNGPLGTNTRITVTFTTSLPFATYYVFFASGAGIVTPGTASFTSDSGIYTSSNLSIQFMVI